MNQPYGWFTGEARAATLGVVDFGKEVRRRRKALGLTIEELAERAELTPDYVGTVETGKRDPSLSTILALAKGLYVPPAELFGGVKELGPAGVEAGGASAAARRGR